MAQAEVKKANGFVRMFSAVSPAFSIVFPAAIFITLAMSLFGFRLADPAAEIGYVALLYVLAFFYLGGLYASRIPLWSLILLHAVFVVLFFMGIKVYWPIMTSILPAIFRGYSQREKDTAGKAISITLAALMVLFFIPTSMMSCEAYSRNQVYRKQALSPDGAHAVEVMVYPDYRLGGHGLASLYEVYPLSLQRQVKVLAQFKWVSLDKVKEPNGSEKGYVGWDVRWVDGQSVALGTYTLDVVNSPFIDEWDGQYAQPALLPAFDLRLPGGRSFRVGPGPVPALIK